MLHFTVIYVVSKLIVVVSRLRESAMVCADFSSYYFLWSCLWELLFFRKTFFKAEVEIFANSQEVMAISRK